MGDNTGLSSAVKWETQPSAPSEYAQPATAPECELGLESGEVRWEGGAGPDLCGNGLANGGGLGMHQRSLDPVEVIRRQGSGLPDRHHVLRILWCRHGL